VETYTDGLSVSAYFCSFFPPRGGFFILIFGRVSEQKSKLQKKIRLAAEKKLQKYADTDNPSV